MTQLSRFSFPTTIHFGNGARALTGPHLRELNKLRPLVVTDAGVRALPICDAFVASLREAGLEPAVFGDVVGNPVKSQVTAGTVAYGAHGADAIIGFGGGAALDVAKAIALMVHHPGDLFDYEDEKPGAREITSQIPYFVALPTTSGTGSEVGRSSVISDDETHIKKIIFSPFLLAKAVFADPELTLELPPAVTAATGMDALTHCVEAYLAKNFHPICDGIALEGLRLAAKSLRRAFDQGKDLGARADMMLSSMMGAIAFQKGLGVTHSCAHALGTACDMHHGLANGVMIDFALAHNAEVSQGRMRTMARTIELSDETSEGFLAYLADLKRKLSIPENLTAASVPRTKLDELVEIATNDGCHPNNPRPCGREDFVRIFTRAFG